MANGDLNRVWDEINKLKDRVNGYAVESQSIKKVEGMLHEHIKDDKESMEKIDYAIGQNNAKLDKILGWRKIFIGIVIGAALMSNETVTSMVLKLL